MLRKKGPFSALAANKAAEDRFWMEFISILNSEKISLAFVITDKSLAKKLGWNEKAILKRAYNKILEEFVKHHLGVYNGKIIVESDPAQDTFLINAHTRLQTIGVPSEGITGSDYRNKITSLSLVNKQNLDDDVQIADSLAIMADVVYNLRIGRTKRLTTIEKMMKRLIERKMNNGKGIFEILV
jgi:hypothetical protein